MFGNSSGPRPAALGQRRGFRPPQLPTSGFRSLARGFSLLETVVALGMFVLVVTTVVDVYLLYSRAQRTGGQRQQIISAASVLLDQIAQEIRLHEIAYWGTLDYNNAAPAETLYEVDVADGATVCEGAPVDNSNHVCNVPGAAVTFRTDIYQRERELVLYDNNGNETASDDTVIAYVFNRRDGGATVDLSPGCTGTVGLFRFVRQGTDPVTCERLFDVPGLDVADAGFYFTQTIEPYPDNVDSATNIQSTFDADCGSGAGVNNFVGGVCKCTAAGQTTDCWSRFCDTATGGRCSLGRNRHPAVTVYFRVHESAAPDTAMTFQTTVSQRLYKR